MTDTIPTPAPAPRLTYAHALTSIAASVGELHPALEALSGLAERAERAPDGEGPRELLGALAEAEEAAAEVATRLQTVRRAVELMGC